MGITGVEKRGTLRHVFFLETLAIVLLPVSCSRTGTVLDQGDMVVPEAKATSGKNNQNNKADRIPGLAVPLDFHDTRDLKIDGKFQDLIWKQSACTGSFVNPGNGRPVKGDEHSASVCMVGTRDALLLAFKVRDMDIVGGFEPNKRDQHLWTRDAVEIMTDPDGDGDNKDYYEIQVNPQNLVFDSFFDDYNKPRVDPDGPFGHQDWNCKLKSAVALHGTLDSSKDRDVGYDVEIFIPWSCFFKAIQSRPRPGQSWRMNFYVMDQGKALSWSPILGKGNFHKADRFGRIDWKAGDGSRNDLHGGSSVRSP
ncbi:MAG: hypothetical protein GXP49_02640 [Deltaproteobacteria bacterium]|nr:hypothetical protein [Deltaproteobacteria bacterium]